MESIKTKIQTSSITTIGPCTVRISPGERCVVICFEEFPRHLIFVQPDRLETCFLCHYAHIEDLESTTHNSAEVQDWLQQDKFQLVRRYKGQSASDFVKVAVAYAKSAVERMELWRGIDDGRRVVGVQRTFEEAKKWEYHYPRPKSPPKLPPGGGKSKCDDKASNTSKGGPHKRSRSSGRG